MMKYLFVFNELPTIYKNVCAKKPKIEMDVKTDEAPFKCNQCKVKSKTLGDLRKHMKTKHKKQQKSVIQTGEMLLAEKELIEQPRKSIKRLPQFTPIAKPFKKSKPELPITLEVFEDEPKEDCNLLKILHENLSLSDISMNDISINIHRNDKETLETKIIMEPNGGLTNTNTSASFYCTECGESFHGETQLDDHTDGAHEKHIVGEKTGHPDAKMSRCDFCEFTSVDQKVVDAHMQRKHEVIQCEKCEYGALDADILKKHMMTHTGNIIFTCYICEFEVTKQSILEDHKESKHSKEEVLPDVLYCEKCEKTYQTKFHLEFHNCKSPYKYPCHICEFIGLSVLEILSHINDDHYKCESCNHFSNTKEDLEKHIQLIHKETKIEIAWEDQNVVQCDQCAYKCRLNIQLKKHRNTVHGNKEPITQSDELFPCNFCDLVFGHFYLLQTHMKDHHTQPQFTCRYCEFTTIENNSLEDHLVDSHEDVVLLHTTAKQVDSLKEDVVELKGLVKSLLENQNKMKEELSSLINVMSDHPLRTHHTTVQPSPPPLYSSVTRRPSAPPPPAPSRTPAPPTTSKGDSVLLVGDSISSQLHLKTIEFAMDTKVKAAKAYSATHVNISTKGKHKPKFPAKNFTEVIANELNKEKVDILLVQAGSVDITDLKTEGENIESTEYFKKETVASAKNLFNAVSSAVTDHPALKKVVIMKQTPRYDYLSSNTPGLKPLLSTLYNETLDQLGMNCTFKEKLIIGTHELNCSGGVLQARYRDTVSGRFDGIHMYGPSGQKAYTASVMKILRSAQLVKNSPPKYYDELDHSNCPQARYQAKQVRLRNSTGGMRNSTRGESNSTGGKSSGYHYSVPTHNRFTQLGDYFPGNF